MKKALFLFTIFTLLLSAVFSASAQRKSNSNFNFDKNRIPAIDRVVYGETQALSEGKGVLLKWRTETEVNNVGFYIYKIVGNEKILVNKFLVGGGYLKTREAVFSNGNYSYFDEEGDLNSTYYIESLSIRNVRTTSEYIFPKFVSYADSLGENLNPASYKRNDTLTNEKITWSKELKEDIGENAVAADLSGQKWVAAQSGVKIGVKREGFYRVSRAELQAGGFDISQPTANWQLYVNGVEQAIIVEPGGDYIEFYGKGINTLESDTQIYFLVVGDRAGKRIPNKTYRQLRVNVLSKSYNQTFFKEERGTYFPKVLNGEYTNFFGTYIDSSNGGSVNFNLSGVDFQTEFAFINLNVQGFTSSAHSVNVKLNGTEIGNLTGSFLQLMSKRIQIPTSILKEGNNTLKLVSTAGSSDANFFDSLSIEYPRDYQANQNSLSFYTNNYRAAELKGFTSPDIRVFDISYPDSPVLYSNLEGEQRNNSFGLTVPANRSRLLFAVTDQGLLKADSLAVNNPSTFSTRAHDADLVIISYGAWITQANQWANYRIADNLKVEVVDIQDVFDEFNFGVVNSDAIKRFLEYAKNNWQTAPKYTLLMGDSTLDPKNHLGRPFQNFVPIKMVDTIYLETGSDEAMADFNNDGLAEIAIGRIPAQNAEMITLVLDKVTKFEQNISLARSRGALFASDRPDGYDFAGLSQRLSNQLPSTIPSVFVNRADSNAKATLIDKMNEGRFAVNYSGHGNISEWASTSFFGRADVSQLSNNENFSIFTMLTCLNGHFFDPNIVSLGESLLNYNNGGAVSTWASSGLTTPDIQEIMATRFYSQLGSGNMNRLGDLIKDAKTTISGGRDVRLSWVLLGDPTLKVK